MPTLVVAVADLHIGSTVGLCPASVQLDDGGTYRTSRPQAWLGQCWDKFWWEVERLKGEIGGLTVGIFNGDIFENMHHATTQLWSHNPADWYQAADMLLDRPMQLTDTNLIMRGTETHSGPSAYLEEAYFSNYENIIKNGDQASWWSGQILVDDVLILARHHNTMGRLPWTQANSLNRTAYVMAESAQRNRTRVPDIALYAHCHVYDESSPSAPVRVIAMPAWQLPTTYGHRLAPDRVADIGGIVTICDRGKAEVRPILYKPKPSRPWQPSRLRKAKGNE